MLNRKTKGEKGVSLVELIVTIAILAILTSVAIISYTVFIKRAKTSKAEQELTQVYNLIYMQADQQTIEIGQNENFETALYVTTSGNKIVLMFNDVPTKPISSEDWDYNDINNWQFEDNWNELLRDLIDEVTGDIKMFSGLFELDPEEPIVEVVAGGQIGVIELRNITYILEKDESLRSRKELLVTTINDVETITRFLSDLERTEGKLVPPGRVFNEGEVEELVFEVWFVWTAAAGFVLSDELKGDLIVDYHIYLESDTLNVEELIAANNSINGNGNFSNRLFAIEIIKNPTLTTDYPDFLTVKVKFNREPYNHYEYNLIQTNNIKIEFTIKIEDIRLVKDSVNDD